MMASSELQKRKQEEYEMQLFGFHSRAVYATCKAPPISVRLECFSDFTAFPSFCLVQHRCSCRWTVENMVSESIQGTIEKLHTAIEKLFKLNSEKRAMLRSNEKHLRKAFRKGAKPYLESMENTVNKYIAIPSNVLLEEDRCQRIQYDDTEFESIKQRLEDLQQRAKRATILNGVLKEELAVLEELPISEKNVNRIYNAIECDSKSSPINEQLFQLVEDYKEFSTVLYGSTRVTEKIKYNTVNNLQCRDFDSSIL